MCIHFTQHCCTINNYLLLLYTDTQSAVEMLLFPAHQEQSLDQRANKDLTVWSSPIKSNMLKNKIKHVLNNFCCGDNFWMIQTFYLNYRNAIRVVQLLSGIAQQFVVWA